MIKAGCIKRLWKKLLPCMLLFCCGMAKAHPAPVFDEITMYATVPGVGSMEVPAVIYNDVPYLSVTAVFDFLQIKNTLSPRMDSISGFFIHPAAVYQINTAENYIWFQQKKTALHQDGLIRTDNHIYLRLDYFETVFALKWKFNFRSLSVVLQTTLELPVMRQMREEAMRKNLDRLRGEEKADTTIQRQYPLFAGGMADWNVITTQYSDAPADTRLSLAMGAVVAGGETNVLLNYSNRIPFTERQQFYQWRRVNQHNRVFSQIMAGKIFPQQTSSVFMPVVGVQFTNAPATYRRSFGSYRLSDRTEPGWMVELYINNVLVNYVQADAAGFFTFDVPLVYGNSLIKLRYYSPWGEERFREQNINIPFNFLPQGRLEYTVSAGVVEDTVGSKLGRAVVDYGLGRRFTIGAGMEYLSSVQSGSKMPFLHASLMLTSKIMLYGEYTHGVRSRALLNYRLPSDLQVELNYIRYAPGQTAINITYEEERKLMVAYPFRKSKISAFTRFSAWQAVLPAVKGTGLQYTTLEALFSGVVLGASANITTYALYTQSPKPYVYTNFSTTVRLPLQCLFTPQLQYEYAAAKLISAKAEIGKYLTGRGYINMFYEKNWKSSFESVGIGLRFDFSFAQTGASVRRSNGATAYVQNAGGSIMPGNGTGSIQTGNRSVVGRAGMVLLPFLDKNGNGKRDAGEPAVAGLGVTINAGTVKHNYSDTSILVYNLEPYAAYLVRFTEAFNSITLHLAYKSMNIMADPNLFKRIEVPVVVREEVAGSVVVEEGSIRKGKGRIKVQYFHEDGSLAGQTVTEADGFFSFSNVAPGRYTACLDAEQLSRLGITAKPDKISFTVAADMELLESVNLKFVIRQ